MSDEDQYNGRRPAFNFRGQVRGFRSKPGATAYNPANTVESPSGFTSNWDNIFRNTGANNFGRNGQQNPTNQRGVALSVAPKNMQPPMPWDVTADEKFGGGEVAMPNDQMADEQFGGGSTLSALTNGSDHAKQWEQQAAKTTQFPQNSVTSSILNRYKTNKNSSDGFGWATAFNDEENNG